ncbi:MAG: hypothetical protein AAGA06_05235 [Pseudomonadota bacterium]
MTCDYWPATGLGLSYGSWWSFAAMASVLTLAIATFFPIPDPRRMTDDTAQDRRLPEG